MGASVTNQRSCKQVGSVVGGEFHHVRSAGAFLHRDEELVVRRCLYVRNNADKLAVRPLEKLFYQLKEGNVLFNDALNKTIIIFLTNGYIGTNK